MNTNAGVQNVLTEPNLGGGYGDQMKEAHHEHEC